MADIGQILSSLANTQVKAVRDAEEKIANRIGDLRKEAMELCWQIEKCGASEELTKASVMASALQRKLNELLP